MTNLFTQAKATQEAYAKYCEQFGADYVYVLNSQSDDLYHEAFSKLLSKLFYQLECSEYTYEKREKYKKVCRIERIVAIEEKQKPHAHILVKKFGNHTEQEVTELIVSAWYALNNSEAHRASEYLVQRINSEIRDNKAVCAYNTKDIARQIINNKDVIDLRSSFIRKHSNKQ
jgi:hypothetical protein